MFRTRCVYSIQKECKELGIWKGCHLPIEGIRKAPALSKMVCKRVRGYTSKRSLPLRLLSSKRISFNTCGKGDLIIKNLGKFKGDAPKTSENVVSQSHKIVQTFVWQWPHQTNVCKIQWLCKAIAALIFNKWLLNLATLPIFRPSNQPCWWAFANRPQYKVDKTVEGSVAFYYITL